MGQLSIYLPPFASDYTGACSALFDIDCMTAITDASCCTSHYVYTDEPRWGEKVKPVFSIALRNVDAVLGNDKKIVDEIIEASAHIDTDMIAVIGTPIPAITGMDVKGIAKEIEDSTGKAVFGFDTTGFEYYDSGMIAAGKALINRFAEKKAICKDTVNVIGTTPLDFGARGNAEALYKKFTNAGIPITTRFFMGISIEQIKSCSQASLNIAVSASGLEICKYLNKKFGTPFSTGIPIGSEYCSEWMKNMRQVRTISDHKANGKRLLIIHDQVIANSIRDALRYFGASFDIDVASFFSFDDELSEPGDCHFRNESQYITHMKQTNYDAVMGDDVIISIPENTNLFKIEEAHPAISGKLSWGKISGYLTKEYEDHLKEIVSKLN
ncbi:MAG: hypothetical protein IKR78_01160 [Dehalococcoidales bacterium]|nr:hypothetical protein [Dehalococcoidales bacterium]